MSSVRGSGQNGDQAKVKPVENTAIQCAEKTDEMTLGYDLTDVFPLH